MSEYYARHRRVAIRQTRRPSVGLGNHLLAFKRSSKNAFSSGGRLANQSRNLFGLFCRTRNRNASTELSACRTSLTAQFACDKSSIVEELPNCPVPVAGHFLLIKNLAN